jgi:hypothetical protein
MMTYTEWRDAIRKTQPLAEFVDHTIGDDLPWIDAYTPDGEYIGSFEILDCGCSNARGYGEPAWFG